MPTVGVDLEELAGRPRGFSPADLRGWRRKPPWPRWRGARTRGEARCARGLRGSAHPPRPREPRSPDGNGRLRPRPDLTGLIVGALARLVLPGRDPMSIFETMLVGIAGTLIAGLITYYLFDREAGPGPALRPVRARDRVRRPQVTRAPARRRGSAPAFIDSPRGQRLRGGHTTSSSRAA